MSWDRLCGSVLNAISEVAAWPADQRIKEADRCADIIASGADAVRGRDGAAARDDMTAEAVWDAVTTGLAILACRPGGVGFDGLHWHADPSLCAECPGPGTLPLFEAGSIEAIGAVFTPPEMARDLAASALPVITQPKSGSAAADIQMTRILDPFCGAGALLVAAARYLGDALAAAWEKHDETEIASLCTLYRTSDRVMVARAYILTQCMFGVDRDPVSVELAGLALQLLAPECPTGHRLQVDDYLCYVASDHTGDPLSWHARLVRPSGPPTARLAGLRCGDALVGRAREPVIAAYPGQVAQFDWLAAFPDVFDQGGFDAVITNPPFAGGNKIPELCGPGYRQYLIEAIAGGRRTVVDLAVYCWMRAHQLASPDGVVAILGPHALLREQAADYRVTMAWLANIGWRPYRMEPKLRWQARSAAVTVCMAWTYRWGGADPQDSIRNVPEYGPDSHLWDLKGTIAVGPYMAEVDGEMIEIPARPYGRWEPKDPPRTGPQRRRRSQPRPASRRTKASR